MEELQLKKDGAIWILDNIENNLQQIYNHFRSLKSENERLRKELERLRSESYKDEELTRMKSDYDQMKADYFRGFPISKEKEDKIKLWQEEIINNYPSDVGTIGGRFHYEFIPTGIGTIGTIVDSITKEKLTFQEIS